jgi:hypothetical protein|tara:strand:- start:22461 stop:23414 length:954 start_codon:yes stop_codon:yes gene_type:complete
MGHTNRIIYQSQAVSVNSVTLDGVQSCNYGIDIGREDVNQFGQLGAVDKVILAAPTCTMEIGYYAGGFGGSSTEGTNLSGLLASGMYGSVSGVNVVAALTTNEGVDYSAAGNAVTLKSGVLTSFSSEASVGAIVNNTLSFAGTDFSYGTVMPAVPGVDLDIATQTGVAVTIDEVGGTSSPTPTATFINYQSATVNYDLGQEVLQRLGDSTTPYYYAVVPTFPATANIDFESLSINDGMHIVVDNLSQSANTPSKSVEAGGYANVTVNVGGVTYKLVNCTMDSHSFSSSIGDNATLSASFAATIGGTLSKSRLDIGQI